MSTAAADSPKHMETNYLTELKQPDTTLDQAYSTPKPVRYDFSYVKGE
jgi:hypothetical protein